MKEASWRHVIVLPDETYASVTTGVCIKDGITEIGDAGTKGMQNFAPLVIKEGLASAADLLLRSGSSQAPEAISERLECG